MLPLSLLRTAQNHPMLVELKNGETYNGHLVSCDNWMNINLREVICTSRDGDKFWRMPECYIRGSTIKYLRIPDEVIDMVKEETQVCLVFNKFVFFTCSFVPRCSAPIGRSVMFYSLNSSSINELSNTVIFSIPNSSS